MLMSKRVNIVTKEMIDTLIEKKGKAVALKEIFYHYFDKQEGDPTRPSNELALYLFKKGVYVESDSYCRPPRWTGLILELGYINLSELLDIVSVSYLTNYRDFLSGLFLTKQFSFPKEEKEMEELLSKLSLGECKKLVEILLEEVVDFSEKPERYIDANKFKNLQNNYINLQDKFCAYFINNSYITESRVWFISSYIPTNIIINKFKKALPLHKDIEEAFSMLHSLIENKKIPFKQLLELIEFFKTFPFTSSSFPYDEKGKMVVILQALPKYEKEIMTADSTIKCKLYNTFIKTLRNNPSLIETHVNEYNIILTTASIAAILVPSGELMSFINDILFQNTTRFVKKSIIERIARTRNRTHAPVPIEFILLQEKYDFYIDSVCFNNDCINDIDFWIKRKERKSYSNSDIIPNSLSFNRSFLYWFKPNPKDLPIYRELYNDGLISSLALSKVRNLPKEFIIAFSHVLSIAHMDKNVLENIIDKDIVSLFLDTREEESLLIPEELFLFNKTFDPAFFAKYATKLSSINRGFIGSKSNVKLCEVVKELV